MHAAPVWRGGGQIGWWWSEEGGCSSDDRASSDPSVLARAASRPQAAPAPLDAAAGKSGVGSFQYDVDPRRWRRRSEDARARDTKGEGRSPLSPFLPTPSHRRRAKAPELPLLLKTDAPFALVRPPANPHPHSPQQLVGRVPDPGLPGTGQRPCTLGRRRSPRSARRAPPRLLLPTTRTTNPPPLTQKTQKQKQKNKNKQSFKAIEKKQTEDVYDWAQYWVVLSALHCLSWLLDAALSWLPFYYVAKLAFVGALWYPQSRLASTLYAKFFAPLVGQYEADIDRAVSEARLRAGDLAAQHGKVLQTQARELTGKATVALKDLQQKALERARAGGALKTPAPVANGKRQ